MITWRDCRIELVVATEDQKSSAPHQSQRQPIPLIHVQTRKSGEMTLTFSDDCPSETRAKTGSDERPKAEDEDAKANGDTEAEFLGGHFDRDT